MKRIQAMKRIKRPLQLQLKIQKKISQITVKFQRIVRHELVPIVYDEYNNKAERIDTKANELLSSWDPVYTAMAKDLASELLSTVQTHVNRSFAKLGKDFALPRDPNPLREAFDTMINQHIDLIKTIPHDILQTYRNELKTSIGNFNQQNIVILARNVAKVNEKRARIIARDQVGKTMERYQMELAEDLGFEYYEWSTSRDERVSSEHKPLDKRYYRYDTPTAIIDKKGTIGIPGQRVNCRCTALPLFTETTDKFIRVTDPKQGDHFILETVK